MYHHGDPHRAPTMNQSARPVAEVPTMANTLKSDPKFAPVAKDPATARAAMLDALRARDLSVARPTLTTGIPALDAELNGGIPTGALTEITGGPGAALRWLTLRILALAQRNGQVCALFDPKNELHPPTAAALGIDLKRLLVIRERDRRAALWALDRVVRCDRVVATLAIGFDLHDTALRRLQLSAEASGQSVLLIRHANGLGRASWGALRLLVRGVPGDQEVGRVGIETLRARGGMMPRTVIAKVDDETRNVCASAVAPDGTLRALRLGVAG